MVKGPPAWIAAAIPGPAGGAGGPPPRTSQRATARLAAPVRTTAAAVRVVIFRTVSPQQSAIGRAPAFDHTLGRRTLVAVRAGRGCGEPTLVLPHFRCTWSRARTMIPL